MQIMRAPHKAAASFVEGLVGRGASEPGSVRPETRWRVPARFQLELLSYVDWEKRRGKGAGLSLGLWRIADAESFSGKQL